MYLPMLLALAEYRYRCRASKDATFLMLGFGDSSSPLIEMLLDTMGRQSCITSSQ